MYNVIYFNTLIIWKVHKNNVHTTIANEGWMFTVQKAVVRPICKNISLIDQIWACLSQNQTVHVCERFAGAVSAWEGSSSICCFYYGGKGCCAGNGGSICSVLLSNEALFSLPCSTHTSVILGFAHILQPSFLLACTIALYRTIEPVPLVSFHGQRNDAEWSLLSPCN